MLGEYSMVGARRGGFECTYASARAKCHLSARVQKVRNWFAANWACIYIVPIFSLRRAYGFLSALADLSGVVSRDDSQLVDRYFFRYVIHVCDFFLRTWSCHRAKQRWFLFFEWKLVCACHSDLCVSTNKVWFKYNRFAFSCHSLSTSDYSSHDARNSCITKNRAKEKRSLFS